MAPRSKEPKAPKAAPKQHPPKPAGVEPMHILKFQAENIKRLKVVEITPKGNVVKLTGDNGSGKSSVLDAIGIALAGTTNLPSEPIRRGEDKGGVRIDLGDLVVTRTMVRGGTHGGFLKITSKSQKSVLQSPQSLLDSLMGRISFDPLEFTRMDPGKQLETLRGLVKVDVDIDAIDTQNKADYDERRILGRQIDTLKVKLAEVPDVAGEVPPAVDVEALAGELAEAGRENTKRQELVSLQQTLHRDYDEHTADADAAMQSVRMIREQIAMLTEKANADEARAKELRTLAQAAIDKADALEIPEVVDTAELERRIREAQATNQRINGLVSQREQRSVLQAEIDSQQRKADELTEARERRLADRTAAIARAKMPIQGLSFGEGEVLLNGLPLAQASSAEQIKTSVALAMASNPTIRVLRIKDGSLLSSRSLEDIAAMAQEHNYQVWIELVDTSGKVGIVMEDGEAHDAEATE